MMFKPTILHSAFYCGKRALCYFLTWLLPGKFASLMFVLNHEYLYIVSVPAAATFFNGFQVYLTAAKCKRELLLKWMTHPQQPTKDENF